MVDDIVEALALVERMRAELPLRAFATKGLRRTLQQTSKQGFPHEFSVPDVRYLGDEGGIACILDLGLDDAKQVQLVSITHLRFDPRHPLAKEIETYCRRRIKRLKKLHRGMGPT